MAVAVSVTTSKDKINLGETITATYRCSGSYDCTIQSDSMPNPITFGSGEVSGTMKFLPTVTGDFTITISGLGVVSQNKGLESDYVEITSASAIVQVI